MTPRQRLGAALAALPFFAIVLTAGVVIFGWKVAALGTLALAVMLALVVVGVDLMEDEPPSILRPPRRPAREDPNEILPSKPWPRR